MMRILVLGSGGLGGYFGGLLARTGQDVRFVARGEHLRALREHGLRVRSYHGDFDLPEVRASDSPAELGPVDLVLFCVKSFDTDSAAEQLRGVLAPGGAVMTLQNGLGNAERIDAVLGAGTTLPAAAHIESAIEAPGVILQSSPRRRITFGEPDGRRTERAERIAAALQAAEIETFLSDQPVAVIWEKFVFITAMAGLTSLTRRTLGEVLGFDETRLLFQLALREAAAVGRASGVPLADGLEAQIEQLAATMAPTMRSSMQKDLERGRRMEVDALNGYTVQLGRELGVPTPVQQVIYAALALENQGR